jgi:Transposase DNA-binding/Transposase Tn5 dimerisation domain
MQDWIQNELGTVRLGDKRLNTRFAKVLDRLSSKPSQSIPAACGGWTDIYAAYRFFANEKVTPAKMLAPHRDATVKRCAGHAVVLVAQDTTELELTRPNEKVGGPLSDEEHWGIHVHPSMVMTPEQIPLGILDVHMWARDLKDYHKRLKARTKPIEEKESFRWLAGYHEACALKREIGSQVVSLSDSEGDIYECFAAWADTSEGATADFIIRACQNRRLSKEDPAYEKDVTTLLWEAVEQASVQGQRTIEVSSRPAQTGDGSKRRQARSARTIDVTLRATAVTLKGLRRPSREGAASTLLPDVTVNVVLVREENPPAGEPAIEWLLVTSLPVTTLDQIETVVDYYCCRWQIEVYFKVVKSGCEVEKLQLETTDRIMNCVAVYLIVAWRVLYLLRLGRECPEMKCDTVLTPEEWQSVWRVVKGEEPPKEIPSLGVMIGLIAQLGGYIPRPNDPPGAKTMWIGLQRTRDFALVWSMLRPPAASKRSLAGAGVM